MGKTARKILLLLGSGLALGLSNSPKTYFSVLKEAAKEWKEINRELLHRHVRKLYDSNLVDWREDDDGNVTLILSEEGRKRYLQYNLDEMRVPKPARWDGKWRIVMFDIPEKLKKVREAVRGHLRQMGFAEFQKSAFIHPHPCRDEVDFIVEFYNIPRFVRQLVVTEIDNEDHFKELFEL